MKRLIILPLLAAAVTGALADSRQTLKSPDGGIEVTVSIGEKISYNVSVDGKTLLTDCVAALQTDKERLGENPKLKSVKRASVDKTERPVVPIKNAQVRNRYNAMTLNMNGGYAVEFRAFDTGVAYRFLMSGKGEVDIIDETCRIGLPAGCKAHLSQTWGFNSMYENPYSRVKLDDYNVTDPMTYLPILIETPDGYKILISESDVSDYPHMFMRSNGRNSLTSVFPKYPERLEISGDRGLRILEEAEYIARTSASRSFPWRYFVLTDDDREIVANQFTYLLASPCELDDVSWIKPGQVSWDWWNIRVVWGVDFKAGVNTATYKYFIDFASKYGVPYIIMDEGWAKDTRNPYVTIPEVDLPELIRYGKERGVGIILWLPWPTVENNMDLFAKYEEWGIPGVKIDFMDRSDQWMVNYYERVIAEAAKHHLVVDFHGSFKPAGLERKYPNLLSYEGVRGMENNENCKPDNTIWLPFIRNAVGAMDFTPGSMNSAQPEYNRCTRPNPMGMGTRACQMAMYVVFESGIQMLADSPSRYYAEPECTQFITSVPVVWDETKVLDAKAGEYVVVARRSGARWFIGAMNDGSKRELTISLDFLCSGAKPTLTCFADGVNADQQANDYVKRTQQVDNATTVTLSLERFGGWCGVIE